ncbi:MAG: MBL fold metallo-hydrolase [Candidatus Helarchaeota archaeon]
MNKVKNIHDDIFLIGGSGISGPGDCLVYLINTDEGLILIDCGVDNRSAAKIANNIKSIDLDPNDLNTLILTHCHIDHVGGASYFKKKYKVKIIAHEIEAPVIEGKEHPERIGAFFYGVDYEPCKVDIKISGDLNEYKLGKKVVKLLFTPGHTPGGISPYIDVEGKRILFGQDIHGPLMKGFGSNLEDYLNSMNKLLALEADILCEGHFGIYSPKEEVSRYIKKYITHYSK